jgi:hypothetical protein
VLEASPEVIVKCFYSAIGSLSLFAFTAGCGSSSSSPGVGSAGSAGVASSAGGASGSTASSAGSAQGGSAQGGNAQGGNAQGGSAQGGSAQGGSAQGGASQGGSSSGAAGTTAAGGSTAGAGAGGGTSSLLVPPSGVTFGSYIGGTTIANLETLLGRKVVVHHDFYGWSDDYGSRIGQDFTAGRVPLVTWEAWDNNNVGTSLDQIAAGTLDTVIHRNALAVKAFGKPFFLRWGHEMNGNWYPWSGAMNGSNAAGVAKYIAAFRHIHDIFKADGATNALFVFCPNSTSVPDVAWNNWANFYPGDDYVDWMCIDGYNWGTVMGLSWQSFQTIFSGIYPGIAAKNKPIIIAETASTEQGGDKAQWIGAILPALKGSFPAIKAFVWFDINKETDWRINSSPAAQTAFVSMVSDPYFNP